MVKRTLILAAAALLTAIACATLDVAAKQAEPRATIDIAGHPFRGPADAPVTVVVFSDYL